LADNRRKIIAKGSRRKQPCKAKNSERNRMFRLIDMGTKPARDVGSDMARLAVFAVFCSELSAIEISFPLKS
jgi:hypothetical protein